MACNCNEQGKTINIGMGCCVPVVANADAYYTKSEIDKKLNDIVISGGGITSGEVQTMIDESVSGYVTTSDFTQYIQNLQDQITQLQIEVSGCCGGGSGVTQTRWITMTGENDYTCNETTKYTKEKEQVSTDGINWTDTGNYRQGSTVLELNSIDCGYVPTIKGKWFATYSDGHTESAECDASSAITDGDINLTNLESIEIGNCVTSIGVGAFSECTSLTSITIGDGVTSIGDYAFDICTSLSSIDIPDNVTTIGESAFAICPSLSSVTIGNGVTSIGNSAFTICISLSSIDIPNSVTTIGEAAFAEGISLTSITIGSGVTSIGVGAFSGCSSLTSINIPNGVTSIGGEAFSGCTSLSSVTIGSGVTSIGGGAFRGCSSLTSINIPNGVTSIGDGAFSGCTSLSSVTIGSGVTSIGNYAFTECTSLTSITIPDSVTIIGDGIEYRECAAFADCTNLSSVTIGSGVTSIGKNTFSGCYILASNFINNSSLNEVEASYWGAELCDYEENGLYIKGNTVIKYKGSEASVIIPNGITNIGSYATNHGNGAFSGCTSLTSVTMPNSVTTIYEVSFKNCTNLTNVTIGNGIEYIDCDAFENCTNLSSVTIAATNPPVICGSPGSFPNTNNDFIIYVPEKSLETYKSKWENLFPNRIRGVSIR